MWRAALLLVAVVAVPARAQAPAATDSAAAALPSLLLPGTAPGRTVSPVPAVTSALSAESFLGRVPGAFDYALGAPGRSGGVSLDGLG